MKRNRSVSPTSDKRIQSRLSPDDDRGESGDVNDAAVHKGRVRRENQNRGFRSGSLFSSDHDFHPAGLVSEPTHETYPWHYLSAGFNRQGTCNGITRVLNIVPQVFKYLVSTKTYPRLDGIEENAEYRDSRVCVDTIYIQIVLRKRETRLRATVSDKLSTRSSNG